MTHYYTDQIGNKISLDEAPRRIISLVPSQTELLFDIGLDEQIVGLTRFCIHPEDKMAGKERIGGTKKFDIEKIKYLQPDLIIGNKEENYKEGITELQKDFPVWMSDIYTLDDAYSMMGSIGEITNRTNEAAAIITDIKSGFRNLLAEEITSKASCAYFIWRKPYMVAASDTFIDHMLAVLGIRNVFADLSRYPEIKPEMLAANTPDVIFLSSEPYSFTAKHMDEFKALSPDSQIMIVNGELFSWYGSRLRFTAPYFEKLRRSIVR